MKIRYILPALLLVGGVASPVVILDASFASKQNIVLLKESAMMF